MSCLGRCLLSPSACSNVIVKCDVLSTALESGEGSANGDTLRDLSRVKKTLRQLLSDLQKVTQIADMSS